MVIDSHFHYLSMLSRDPSLSLTDDLIGIEVGIDSADLERRIKAVGPNENIFLSVGAGPWALDRDRFVSIEDELERIEKDIEAYSADAIGETGYDNHWGYGTKELQHELFLGHVSLARKHNLPLIIHTREADEEIKKAASDGYIDERTIMHCYSSGKELCKLLLSKGAYISFAGNITYKPNQDIRDAASIVPLDRLLVETDSPYLAPGKMRGKINTPLNTEITLDLISEIKGADKQELKNSIKENLYRVLGTLKSKVKRDIP